MPNYFPEGDAAAPADTIERSMAKVVSQLPGALDVLTEELIPEPSFAPTDLPELELWLDANEGLVNTPGNYFTDETASFEFESSGLTTSTLTVQNTWYGRPELEAAYGTVVGNVYVAQLFPGLEYVGFKTLSGGVWLIAEFDTTGEEGFFLTSRVSTGSVSYPWQATWPSGTTVTRTPTTTDVLATNDQSVAQWNNKASGKPNLAQPTAAAQPIFKSDVFGRKAVLFNGDALSNSGFSAAGQQYSYYLVATTLEGSQSAAVHAAMKQGNNAITQRGIFGANATVLAVQNASTIKTTTFVKTVTLSSAVFSARFNLSSGIVDVGKNLSFQQTTGNATTSSSLTSFTIGAGNNNGSSGPINSNFSEVLVYNAHHNEATALQVINYLVQKWNINTAL